MQRDNTMTLGFLIFPGFPMACLTSAIEPLRIADQLTGRARFFQVGDNGWCARAVE